MSSIAIVIPDKKAEGDVELPLHLLKLAEEEGFTNPSNPYCRQFFKLYTCTGGVHIDNSTDEKMQRWEYVKSLILDSSIPYEKKEPVGAFLLSTLTINQDV